MSDVAVENQPFFVVSGVAGVVLKVADDITVLRCLLNVIALLVH